MYLYTCRERVRDMCFKFHLLGYFTQLKVVMNPNHCQNPLAKSQTMNCDYKFYCFKYYMFHEK